MYKSYIFMHFSTIFTVLFYPYIARERTAQNLDFVSLLIACRSSLFFLLSAIAPKMKVPQERRAIEQFQRVMCPALMFTYISLFIYVTLLYVMYTPHVKVPVLYVHMLQYWVYTWHSSVMNTCMQYNNICSPELGTSLFEIAQSLFAPLFWERWRSIRIRATSKLTKSKF